MGIIYKITNLINGKIYVGQTKRDMDVRFREHKTDSRAKKPSSSIHKAIKKYGEENFTIEKIIDVEDENNILIIEQYYINFYNSCNDDVGYNMTSFLDRNLDLNIEDIYFDIINTKNNLKTIGEKYNLSRSDMSRINSGAILKKENIEYPIRKCSDFFVENEDGLSEDDVVSIVCLLKTKKIFILDIANQFNISKSIVMNINSGRNIKYIKLLDRLGVAVSYPIKDINLKDTPKNIVESIYHALLKTDMTMVLISEKYDVSVTLVANINSGKFYSDTLSDYNISYPIRDTNMSARITDNYANFICNLLRNTKKSIAFLAKALKISESTLSKINRGDRYRKISLELFGEDTVFTLRPKKLSTYIVNIKLEEELLNKINEYTI